MKSQGKVCANDYREALFRNVMMYLDIPGRPRRRVGAPQRPRDTPRAPHADCRARLLSARDSSAHASSLLAPAQFNKQNRTRSYKR